MRRISCGISGTNEMPATHKLSEIPISEEIKKAFLTYYRKDLTLRPAQDQAVFEENLLSNTGNLIIATPTNSGKSMLSYLLLFQEAIEGRNVVLVEPLRVLAYEKAEELRAIADIIRKQSHIKVKITISTGDYRLTDQFMATKPEQHKSGQGQVIVATPERLDAISRMKENENWFKALSLVCFDEAHLIGDSNRGPTLELLIAYLRTMQDPARIVLMSATIANPDELAKWLSPCHIIIALQRYPQLEKWVYCIDDGEDSNDILVSEIQKILSEDGTSVIVFVYQTASAESFANHIAKTLSGRRIPAHDLSANMNTGVAWFHANMSTATKTSIIEAMESGKVRVTVSTTALSMGINLPATHVFVRDITFTGFKDLNVGDLLQMLGRAGRGNHSGFGAVLLSKSNLSKEHVIVEGLSNEEVPTIRSALLPESRDGYYGSAGLDLFYIDRVGNQVIGALNRFQSVTWSVIVEYLKNTLCGDRFENLNELVRYLIDWKLVWQDEATKEYALTALGKVSSRCYFPPLTAANIGQFIRDLLSDDLTGKHVSELTPIDYIIMLCLCSNEFKPITRYSKKIEATILNYMEGLPAEEKSYLYRSWIKSDPESVWGSARVDYSQKDAKKQVFQRVFTAMLIYDLSKGLPSSQLKDYYKVDVEELQEKLRDSIIWLVSGVERVLNVRTFYYHLKENCMAESTDIHSVEMAFKKGSSTLFRLIGNLKFRSKLGELIRGIKRVYPHAESYPGEGTIRRLEENGIHSLKDLVGKKTCDLTDMGIQKKHADLIIGYIVKRRS